MEQYNIKITAEQKERATVISKKFENKSVFIETLLNTYEANQDILDIKLDIDSKRFDDLLVEQVQELFTNFLNTISISQNRHKQSILAYEEKNKKIDELEHSYKEQIVALQFKNEELNGVNLALEDTIATLNEDLQTAQLHNQKIFALLDEVDALKKELHDKHYEEAS